MEIIKWLIGVAVGAFVAGVGVIQFLDGRIDEGIKDSLLENGVIGSKYDPLHDEYTRKIGEIESKVNDINAIKPLEMGVKHNLIKGAKLPITLEEPGFLIVSLNVENNERRAKNNQRTIFSRSQILLNQQICADDYSAYYVWDGIAMSNSVCMKHLEIGNHEIAFNGLSSNSGTTKNRVSYVIFPMTK